MTFRVDYVLEHLPRFAEFPNESDAFKFIAWGEREDVFTNATCTEVMEVETVG